MVSISCVGSCVLFSLLYLRYLQSSMMTAKLRTSEQKIGSDRVTGSPGQLLPGRVGSRVRSGHGSILLSPIPPLLLAQFSVPVYSRCTLFHLLCHHQIIIVRLASFQWAAPLAASKLQSGLSRSFFIATNQEMRGDYLTYILLCTAPLSYVWGAP